jgi:thiamine monophosphate synthase
MSDALCRLYLITPERLDPPVFRDSLAAALDAGDVACLQLRLKDASEDQIKRATEILMPIAAARDVAFLLPSSAAMARISAKPMAITPKRAACLMGAFLVSPAMPQGISR